MSSVSLRDWQSVRLSRLHEIDTQCADTLELMVPNPLLADENLRGYIILLSAHFQGFCRDLYTESSQIIASKVRPSLQVLIQAQFTANRALDHGNPNLHNLKKDFDRLGLTLNLTNDQQTVFGYNT